MENFTTTESAECKVRLNSPFKEVSVTLPWLNTETVASSMGDSFSSVTRPCSVNVWAFRLIDNSDNTVAQINIT